MFVEYDIKRIARYLSAGFVDAGSLALKWCKRCGGKHRGVCRVVQTSAGTFARPDLASILDERRASGER